MAESNRRIKMVGLGAGGHCRALLNLIECLQLYNVVGLTDQDARIQGDECGGAKILGDDEYLEILRKEGVFTAFLGVGSVGDGTLRKRLYKKLLDLDFQLPSLSHPSAILTSDVKIGQGCQIMPGVIVNPCTRIGENTILNTACVIEHDCQIGAHVHVSPRVVMGGGVKVSEGAHVGIGATIREGIQIGKGAFIAAGSVVVKNVLPHDKVMGVPARSY